jgi:hypothetical protein
LMSEPNNNVNATCAKLCGTKEEVMEGVAELCDGYPKASWTYNKKGRVVSKAASEGQLKRHKAAANDDDQANLTTQRNLTIQRNAIAIQSISIPKFLTTQSYNTINSREHSLLFRALPHSPTRRGGL